MGMKPRGGVGLGLVSLLLTAACTSGLANPRVVPDEPAESAPAVVSAEPMPETAEATANTPESAPAPNLEAEFQAQTQQATDPYFVDENGLAIRGTDPVAYFTEGAAVPGRAEFSYRWGNATWQFSSAAHRDQFAANPEQYAPQYGGFCAWAVSQGYTAPIDPNAWRIVDGRLYLNFSPGVQRRWERNIPGNIAQANVNWPSVYEGQ